MDVQNFAARIRERYPEGLTGIFAIGGTRTTYILSQNRGTDDPGMIKDFAAHGAYLQKRYQQFINMFFTLGGQNMIITASSFRGFHERGGEYATLVANELVRLIDDDFLSFYRASNIDPYFVGIDTLLHLPSNSSAHQLGRRLEAFQKQWAYGEGRYRLIWEIASIPLYSFWTVFQGMSDGERNALNMELGALTSMEALHTALYRHFARAVYGTELPMPHLYVGTNKSGDLKWRSPMPIALTGGEYMRMFYTPYPTLFMTEEVLHAILDDLAFNRRFHSLKTDYQGQYTAELAQAEYERVMALSANPETTLGFSRKVTPSETPVS